MVRARCAFVLIVDFLVAPVISEGQERLRFSDFGHGHPCLPGRSARHCLQSPGP
jgi:hypothetical protein